MVADYDRSSVVTTLTSEDPRFEPAGSYRGYDVYQNEQVGFAVGLDGDTLVAGKRMPVVDGTDVEGTAVLETTIDTREGEVTRHAWRQWLDDRGGGAYEITDPSLSFDGRVVVVEGPAETENLTPPFASL
ncbi:hypothetical protein BRC81_06655 [Halobacteriales archaeon QS_1_68_20]|nr:MAG: hypothetical protein BRC81_06655 [Halobacteriales archaeon QS_1_68_20]